MNPFRKLIMISLGRESCFEKDPSRKDWASLFARARQQTLIGVLNEGVHRLPADQLPPEDILSHWDELTGKIASIYQLHEKRTLELADILEQHGLRGCILKGTGLSRLYPAPEKRMCGDIDVWIEGSHKHTIRALEGSYHISEVLYQECKAAMFDDVLVEVHFHPTKMYNPVLNVRLQRWLEANSPFSDTAPLSWPGPYFNAVFCMAHMFRHYLEGGIGFRQMMDYYYVLLALEPSQRGPAMKALKRLGMKRFTAAVMLVMQSFGLEDEYLLCPPDLKYGKKLGNEIYRQGNFGVSDTRNRAPEGESRQARFMRKNRRVLSNLRWYPREVFWSPFARLSQHFWRLANGYL